MTEREYKKLEKKYKLEKEKREKLEKQKERLETLASFIKQLHHRAKHLKDVQMSFSFSYWDPTDHYQCYSYTIKDTEALIPVFDAVLQDKQKEYNKAIKEEE